MANICLTLYTNGFFGSFLKSPTQMGSLSINNSVTNISRLGTFNILRVLQLDPHLLHGEAEVSDKEITLNILRVIQQDPHLLQGRV